MTRFVGHACPRNKPAGSKVAVERLHQRLCRISELAGRAWTDGGPEVLGDIACIASGGAYSTRDGEALDDERSQVCAEGDHGTCMLPSCLCCCHGTALRSIASSEGDQ